MATATIEVRPAGPGRWADVERVLGPKGAYAGCWCMFFRLPGREFEACSGGPSRWRAGRLVRGRAAPGLPADLALPGE